MTRILAFDISDVAPAMKSPSGRKWLALSSLTAITTGINERLEREYGLRLSEAVNE
jgi:hypothetical protein